VLSVARGYSRTRAPRGTHWVQNPDFSRRGAGPTTTHKACKWSRLHG